MDVSKLFKLPSVPASAINKRKWTAPPPGPNAQGSVVDIDHDKHEASATPHAKRARVTTVDEDLEIEREGSSGGGDDGDGEAALDQVTARGLRPVTSLVRRSSLEDVFLRLTGRHPVGTWLTPEAYRELYEASVAPRPDWALDLLDHQRRSREAPQRFPLPPDRPR